MSPLSCYQTQRLHGSFATTCPHAFLCRPASTVFFIYNNLGFNIHIASPQGQMNNYVWIYSMWPPPVSLVKSYYSKYAEHAATCNCWCTMMQQLHRNNEPVSLSILWSNALNIYTGEKRESQATTVYWWAEAAAAAASTDPWSHLQKGWWSSGPCITLKVKSWCNFNSTE